MGKGKKVEAPQGDAEVIEQIEKVLNPRDAMMELVVNSAVDDREQKYLEEGMDPPGADKDLPIVDDEVIEEVEVIEDVEDQKEIIDKQTDVVDTQVITRDGQTFINVKIDGIEQEVPVGDMITHYQKNENADKKLGQANQLLSQARDIQQSPASTLPDDSHDPVVDKSAVNSAFEKLYDGDVEGAAEEFSAQLSKHSAPQVDISAEVAREVARITDQTDLNNSFSRFKSNETFKQIVEDPTLMGKVDAFTVELQQDQEFMATNPTYEDIFNEAGRRTNDWVATIAPSTVSDENIESRRDRKVSKTPAVNSRTARRGRKPEPKPATREDNIAAMARARGQSIY